MDNISDEEKERSKTIRLWFVQNFEEFISDFEYDLLLCLSETIDLNIATKKRNLN